MGLDFNGVHFLLFAQRLGVNFEKIAMIGRQSLDLTKAELKDSLQAFGYSVDNELINHIFNKCDGYAEPLLTHLGAKDVHSFDFSAYEGATHLHDMNREVSPEIKEQYSTVLDGGSLEHVFNFPVAIKNCMEMLRIGGYYMGITPANNFMGHGFYQFSPEMYFSVFTQQNGFELISLIAFEDRPGTTWYSVRSPREIKGRVSLVNNRPVYLLVVAKKVAKTIIFEMTPQQSDYITAWHRDDIASDGTLPNVPEIAKRNSLLNWVKRNIPFPMRHLLKGIIQGYGFNPRFFLPIDPTATRQLPKE